MLLRSSLTVGDVFLARAALETQLCVIATRNHTPELIDRVVTAFDRFERAVVDRADAAAIARGHVEFHAELLRATNLPALEILLQPVQEMMLATSVPGYGGDPLDPSAWRVAEHRQVLDAVASRDEGRVVAACEEHWAVPLYDKSFEATRTMRVRDVYASPSELLSLDGGAAGA